MRIYHLRLPSAFATLRLHPDVSQQPTRSATSGQHGAILRRQRRPAEARKLRVPRRPLAACACGPRMHRRSIQRCVCHGQCTWTCVELSSRSQHAARPAITAPGGAGRGVGAAALPFGPSHAPPQQPATATAPLPPRFPSAHRASDCRAALSRSTRIPPARPCPSPLPPPHVEPPPPAPTPDGAACAGLCRRRRWLHSRGLWQRTERL